MCIRPGGGRRSLAASHTKPTLGAELVGRIGLGLVTLIGALVVSAPTVAQEHPLLERARRASDRGDFEQARSELAELPATLGLSREDLRDVLLLRASVSYALGDIDAMQADLADVARFVPPDELPQDAPPLVRQGAEQRASSVEPVYVRVQPLRTDGEVALDVEAPPTDRLVQGVRVFVRVGDEGAWRAARGHQPVIATDEDLELYAELLGPGGAVLARAGSREAPLHSAASGGVSWWPFVLGGAVIAIGVAIVVVLASSGDDSVQLGPTMVEW